MIEERKKRALLVDDEKLNLEILREDLEEEGFEVVTALDGLIAWNILQKDNKFDVILLDRMMPNMDGMELIAKLKQETESIINDIPIIMQTAAAEKWQVVDGINAGVYYYLTKPFDKALMLSIVRSAGADFSELDNLKNELNQFKSKLHLVKESMFELSTLEDAKHLAKFLSCHFPDAERVHFGLSELLINAVEHGNLGVTYEDKTGLMHSNMWAAEVERRQKLPENINKKVLVNFARKPSAISVKIKDEGKGFDWKKYEEISPERATDPHGRGIALSKMMSFDNIEYMGKGNEVVCSINA